MTSDTFHEEAAKVLALALNGADADFQNAADSIVEKALFARAVGFSYPAEKISIDNKTGDVNRADTIEYVIPDVAAQMNWLTNRKPDKWQSKGVTVRAGSGAGSTEGDGPVVPVINVSISTS